MPGQTTACRHLQPATLALQECPFTQHSWRLPHPENYASSSHLAPTQQTTQAAASLPHLHSTHSAPLPCSPQILRQHCQPTSSRPRSRSSWSCCALLDSVLLAPLLAPLVLSLFPLPPFHAFHSTWLHATWHFYSPPPLIPSLLLCPFYFSIHCPRSLHRTTLPLAQTTFPEICVSPHLQTQEQAAS